MASDVAVVEPALSASAVEAVLLDGDLAKLQPAERVVYYHRVCESVGLNPLTKPFEYIRLNGKLVLYARRDCTEQLRKLHGVSVSDMTTELIGDVYVVRATFTDRHGRTDQATGAVPIKGLSGENLANAYLKAETKCKRRGTLSICGLGMLDETEVASIPGAKPGDAEAPAPSPFTPPRRKSATLPSAVTPVTGRCLDCGADVPAEGFTDHTCEREPGSDEDLNALDRQEAALEGEAPPRAPAQLPLTPPADAISPARVKRVYALIHAALQEHGCADTSESVKLVEDKLNELTMRHLEIPVWKHVSWKGPKGETEYDRVCAAIGPIVEKLARGA
jgi:hypothetical protein